MTTLTVFVVVLLAAAAYATKPIRLLSIEETTISNYHTRIGVPEAKRIQLEEEQFTRDPSRIVGGSPANLGQHPHKAGLLISLHSGATSVCGASLITNTNLVTAAHCWWDGQTQANTFIVVLGTVFLFSGGFRISPSHVLMNENYNPINYMNDVALIYTSHIAYTNTIQNIPLPDLDTETNYAGNWAFAPGFGRHSDAEGMPANPQLRQVQLQVITNEVCQQTYSTNVIHGSSICTSGQGGVGICGGDSGGPLALAGTARILIGISSFASAYGCEVGHPSVHVRVTAVMGWIRWHAGLPLWPQ